MSMLGLKKINASKQLNFGKKPWEKGRLVDDTYDNSCTIGESVVWEWW